VSATRSLVLLKLADLARQSAINRDRTNMSLVSDVLDLLVHQVTMQLAAPGKASATPRPPLLTDAEREAIKAARQPDWQEHPGQPGQKS
jgi:hypothetical protein